VTTARAGADAVQADDARGAACAAGRAPSAAAIALRLDDEIAPREDARRICLCAFRATQTPEQSLLVRIGERASTIVFAARQQPVAFWSLSHALLRQVLAHAAPEARFAAEHARLLRAAARETVRPARLAVLRGLALPGIGTSGIARAIISVAGDGGPRVTLARVARAVDRVCVAWSTGGLPPFARDCVAAMLVGAVVLEAVGESVGLPGYVTREGLRDELRTAEKSV
jgi:hypothetical protein